MPDPPRNEALRSADLPDDANQRAKAIIDQVTGETDDSNETGDDAENRASDRDTGPV